MEKARPAKGLQREKEKKGEGIKLYKKDKKKMKQNAPKKGVN